MDNSGCKWMKWMGKRQKDNWHCLQQSLQVSSQEVFHGDATATDDKSPFRLELLLEQSQSLVVGSAPTFHLNGYALSVVFDDEVHLVVALAPIIRFKRGSSMRDCNTENCGLCALL